MLSNILDRISFWALFLVVVLLPVFFLPFIPISIETSKGLLLVVGLSVSIIFWAMARFSDGKIVLPKSWLLFSGLLLVLVSLLSTLFSATFKVSMFGTMFDLGSFYFIFSAFLLMLVSSLVLRDAKNAKIVFWGLIVSSIFLLVFQSLRIFLPNMLSLGVLSGKTATIIGAWNTFGIFSGFFALVSLFVIEFFPVAKGVKFVLEGLVVLSLLTIASVNFSFVWVLLGIFALIIFIYKVSFFSSNRAEGEKTVFPAFSLAIVMISLLFFVSGQYIGSFLPNYLKVTNIEIAPSFSATMSVTNSVLKDSPILGIGPNKFGQAWSLYKPVVVNGTQFWDTYFTFGSGLLPTFASTTGYLGIFSWLLFFYLFIVSGVKFIFHKFKKNINWEMALFFIASLYLFVSSFFYSTGSVIFLLAFAFTGVFIGLSNASREEGEATMSFLNDSRKSFFSIFILIVIIIVSATASIKYIERLVSVSYFQKAISARDVATAEDYIVRANQLNSNDLYLRTYAEVNLSKINSLVAKGSSLSDADKSDLQASLNQAVNGAQLAIAYDRTNYLNFVSLGQIYNVAGSIGVKDTYSKAIDAYTKASSLNPLNPGLKLSLARIFFANGQIKESIDVGKQAVSLKPDYIEALVALSQIEKSSGDSASALSYAQSALSFDSQNKDLIQYVNSLKNGIYAPAPVINTPSVNTSTETVKNKKKI